MRCRCVREESVGIKNEKLIYTVRQDLAFDMAFNSRACNHCMQLHAQLVGQTATFG